MEYCSQIYTLLYSLYDFICEFVSIHSMNYLQIAYMCTISHFYCRFCVCIEKLYPIA